MSYNVEGIRTVAICGHGKSGKTTFCEAMLYAFGMSDRMGSVDGGNSILDYEPEEVKRKITISSSMHHIDTKRGRIHIVDTPGDSNFFADVRASLQVVDGVILLVDAVSGIRVQTERVWEFANELGLPVFFVVTKMDRERADFSRILDQIKERFEIQKLLPVIYPIGKEEKFCGVVDVIGRMGSFYENGKHVEKSVPEEILGEVDSLREKIFEDVAELEDELLEKYLEEGELSQKEVEEALRKGVCKGEVTLVGCCSSPKLLGIHKIGETIFKYMPSPKEKGPKKALSDGGEIEIDPDPSKAFSGLVFKTIADPYTGRLSLFRIFSGSLTPDSEVYNLKKGEKEKIGQIYLVEGKSQKPVEKLIPGEIGACAKLKVTQTGDTLSSQNDGFEFPFVSSPSPIISYALHPKTKGDEERITTSLAKLMEEDPSIRVKRDDQTKEIILSGMGQVHIEVILEKLKRKFGVEAELRLPKVPYRETIKSKAKAQGKYKRQSGGRGQYGDAVIEIEPLPRGEGFKFVDKIVGGVIPKNYIPAVEKGIVEAMAEGILAGYPVVDVKVDLVFGSYHPVDSSDLAFKIAGSMAFKKAAQEANPVILEPIMNMEITVPDECMGDVIGDLNGRRGKVLGIEPKKGMQVIKAQVPLAEVLTYALTLSSITGDRGTFTMEFSHYEEVPPNISEKIIEEAKREKS